MKIILGQCDKGTRAEIALGPSYEDNHKERELIKFLMRVNKVCNNNEETDEFFGFCVTRIIKHNFRPATIVEQLIAKYPNNDAIWDNADL